MRVIRLTPFWFLGLALFGLSTSIQLLEADPWDDFSFTLGASAKTEVYRFLSVEKVSEILSDRLDLFPASKIPHLARHLIFLCQHYRFDPAFILSLMDVESSFRVKALSPVGAVGLMQLMVPTAQFVVDHLEVELSGFETYQEEDLYRRPLSASSLRDPFANISLGITYLAWLRDHYEGYPPSHLLAAYNLGPAKLDTLLSKKYFEPVETKKYFQAIRRKTHGFRSYNSI